MTDNGDEMEREKNGNSKHSSRDTQAKYWEFTLNNYLETDIQDFVALLGKDDKYVIGKEVGDSGTPHLQGHIEFKKGRRLSAVRKLIPRAHWGKCRNKTACRSYCQKEGEFVTNLSIPRKIVFPEMDRPWELDILKLIKTDPDNRTIHWYWEPIGNSGKTTFIKYLKVHHKAIECPSRSTDAFYRIAKEVEKENAIDLVVYDIPRSSMGFVNYGAIEKVKDGNVCSGKYEGCDCVFACPHVIVFANEPPVSTELSGDRWNIVEIVGHAPPAS